MSISVAEAIEKKLARIDACIADLERADPERIENDVRERRFVQRTVQMAIQAALDAASYIISEEHLPEPENLRDFFTQLERARLLPAELTTELESLADYRDDLVYRDETVDLQRLERLVRSRGVDLQRFAYVIRSRLSQR